MLVQVNQSDVRLHRHMLCRRRAERIFEHSIRLGEGRIDVTGAKLEVVANV